MSRLVTLMTCQWTDMDLETLCQKAKAWGYDGLELAPHCIYLPAGENTLMQ